MRLILVVKDLRHGGGVSARSVRATLLQAGLHVETFVTGDPLVAKHEEWLFRGLPRITPTLYVIDDGDGVQDAIRAAGDPRVLDFLIKQIKDEPPEPKLHQSTGDQVV